MRHRAPTCFFRFSSVVLAISLGVLPALSTIHLAMVPHVYSVDHRHYHEIVTVFENGRSADWSSQDSEEPTEPAGNLRDWSAELHVLQVECPLANLSLRNELLVEAAVTLPGVVAAGNRLTVRRQHRGLCSQVLMVAPKHSPPLHQA